MGKKKSTDQTAGLIRKEKLCLYFTNYGRCRKHLSWGDRSWGDQYFGQLLWLQCSGDRSIIECGQQSEKQLSHSGKAKCIYIFYF